VQTLLYRPRGHSGIKRWDVHCASKEELYCPPTSALLTLGRRRTTLREIPRAIIWPKVYRFSTRKGSLTSISSQGTSYIRVTSLFNHRLGQCYPVGGHGEQINDYCGRMGWIAPQIEEENNPRRMYVLSWPISESVSVLALFADSETQGTNYSELLQRS